MTNPFPFTEAQTKWIAELRSGNRKQTTQVLERVNPETFETEGFCCLGVGCSMFLSETRSRDDSSEDVYYGDDYATDTEAPPELVEILHLRGDEGDFDFDHLSDAVVDTLPYNQRGGGTCSNLAALNDMGWTFEQIADFIEANPKAVFTNA